MTEETMPASFVESTVRDIRRKTREKVRVVLEGLQGEEQISEIARRAGIHTEYVLPVVQRIFGSRQAAPSR